MKKLVCLVLALTMLASLAIMSVSATDILLSAPAATAAGPDWVITELNPDQVGDGTGGWSTGADCFEFFELYNNSDRTLNLYDYAMFYSGVAITDAQDRFEKVIFEYTPFLAGDWRDNWSEWTYTDHLYCGDENLPAPNPATCEVAPGEVVVIWSVFPEANYQDWNDGKGMQIEDFRNFWQVPENVKVICWDGNNWQASYPRGGHYKNFNLKNSACGSYGICLLSDAINATANTGEDNLEGHVYNGSWLENPDLISWSIADYSMIGGTGVANTSFNFGLDNQQLGANEVGLEYDVRRTMLLEGIADATAGTLTTMQKLNLGVALDAGESLAINSVYTPFVDGQDFLGIEINGTLYGPKDTFTAAEAGVYTISYKYASKETEPVVTTTAEPVDDVTTPADTTTAEPVDEPTTPADTTTAAPTTTPAPTTEPTEPSGGCGSFVALGMMAWIIPAAVVVCKKRK